VIEEEAIDLHLIAMSSRPPILYWKPATLAVLEAVRDLREEGIEAYSTMDAGANVHVITLPEREETVAARLAELEGVGEVIRDGVGPGPRVEAGLSL
jgi:diphosphomevalonate decarboxylase